MRIPDGLLRGKDNLGKIKDTAFILAVSLLFLLFIKSGFYHIV